MATEFKSPPCDDSRAAPGRGWRLRDRLWTGVANPPVGGRVQPAGCMKYIKECSIQFEIMKKAANADRIALPGSGGRDFEAGGRRGSRRSSTRWGDAELARPQRCPRLYQELPPNRVCIREYPGGAVFRYACRVASCFPFGGDGSLYDFPWLLGPFISK